MSSQVQADEANGPDVPLTTERLKARRKQAVRERDQHECTNCGRHKTDVDELDVHHIVPLGQGGSWLLSNMVTLCRGCHNAVHGDGTAPTVRWCSTRNMTPDEFEGYNTLVQGLLPAYGEQVGVVIDPMFNLHGREEWHVPLVHVEQLQDATNGVLREG
jgi:hypothetical protein